MMSGRHFGSVVASVLAFCVTRADEPAAPPAAQPENSLTAAKQDYEAIKAARSLVAQPSRELPKPETPALQVDTVLLMPPTTSADLPARSTPAGKNSPTGESRNWLLDAMGDADAHPFASGQQQNRRAPDSTSPSLTRPPGDVPRTSLTDPTRPATSPEKPERMAFNPLANYMSSWIAPWDRALLATLKRSQGEDGLAAMLDPASSGNPPRAALSSPATTDTSDPASGEAGFPSVAADPSRSSPNPYLSDSHPIPESVHVPPPTFSAANPAPAPPPANSVSQPAPPAAPPPTLADQFKAREEDERAFKQLKRF